MQWLYKRTVKSGRIYSAIDIGTTKVCTLVASTEGEGVNLRIIGIGIVRSEGMKKAMITDANSVVDSIKSSVKEAEKSSGLKVRSAFIGITGSHISSFNTRDSLYIPPDKAVGKEEIKHILSKAKDIPMPDGRELIHTIPQNYRVDGMTGSLNPVGLRGTRLDAEVHMVTAAASAVQNLIDAVNRAGIKVEAVVPEPLASGEAVLQPDEKNAGVIIIDIGGGTTDIAVFKFGAVYHTSAVPVAGYQLTRDLAIGLGVSYEEAEELKLKYANLDPQKAYPYSEVMFKPRDGLNIPYADFRNIINERITELFQLVYIRLSGGDLRRLAPSGAVLTGGTAKLPGIADLSKRTLNLPCRIGLPRNINGMTEDLQDPAFATSIGLLYCGARHSETAVKKLHQQSQFERLWNRVRQRISR